MELVLLLGLISLGCIAYAVRIVKPAYARPVDPVQNRFGIPDAVLATLLCALFGFLLFASHGKKVEITDKVLVDNALSSFFLVIFVVSLLIFRSINPLTLFGLTFAGLSRSIRPGLIALAVALPVIFFVHALSSHFVGPQPQPLLEFLATHDGIKERALLAFTAIVVAPITEETIFRGYIYGVVRKYGGRWVALAVSAFVFAAIHGHLPAMAGLITLSVALTLAYEYTSSLWTPMLMHAVFNTITVVITLAFPDFMK